jgi:hypothetical protein
LNVPSFVSSLSCALLRGFAFLQAERSRAGELSSSNLLGCFGLPGLMPGYALNC